VQAQSTNSEKTPASVRIVLYDMEHEVDLDACRAAMPYRVAELRAADPDTGGRELIAKAADVDPKTLRTFLGGGRVSAESLIDIIERGLGLKLADVVKPVKAA
jgi:hypothetical protein